MATTLLFHAAWHQTLHFKSTRLSIFDTISRHICVSSNRSKIRTIRHERVVSLSSRSHRSISSSSLRHDKATTDAATEATDATLNEARKSDVAANVIKPKPLFPWRHSSHPLPRLVVPPNTEDYYESEYHTKGGHLGPGWPYAMPTWFRMACQANSMRLLGLTYVSMLMPWSRRAWIREMEDAFCDAFWRGVQGVILDTYAMKGVLL